MSVRILPHEEWHPAQPGETLLQVAARAGVALDAVCGGRGTCGKCHVVVVEGALSPVTPAEEQALSREQLGRGYRLACQAQIVGMDAVVIRIAEEARQQPVQILSAGVNNGHELDPWVTRHHLTVPPAGIEDQTADQAALEQAWAAQSSEPLQLDLAALRQLPDALRAEDGRITLVRVRDIVIRVQPGHRTDRLLGMAVDIGTTTVVGYLLDLASGEELAVSAELNPQTRQGDNVISRIEYASSAPEGLATLQSEIVACLNRIMEATCAESGERPADIVALTLVGNTTMQHLLLGVSPEHLAHSPYIPAFAAAQGVRAERLGLHSDPHALVWLLPNIAGWVGADTVGVLLATGLWRDAEPALAIDIGTNGEMAMTSGRRVITCSTAAGPAFEGAHISCGMRAAAGAIDHVEIAADIQAHTIADEAPRGVCGSGLVDAVAELIRVGAIDSQGRLQSAETVATLGLPDLAARIQGENRQRSIVLAQAAESGSDHAIALTQRDIRELQLAKGAVRAGIEILMKELGLRPEKIRRVYLAGAFGNYIQPSSALGIGLLPRFPNAELIPVGNAAGSGARQALLSRAECQAATELARQVEYLELSGRTDFQDEFVEAMLF